MVINSSGDAGDSMEQHKIVLEYECNLCQGRRYKIFKSFAIAMRTKVYCDYCLLERMQCITDGYESLIATLN